MDIIPWVDQKLAQILRKIRDEENFTSFIQILGPAPAPFTKLREQYRFHIIIKGASSSELHRLVKEAINRFSKPSNILLIIDVDPQMML